MAENEVAPTPGATSRVKNLYRKAASNTIAPMVYQWLEDRRAHSRAILVLCGLMVVDFLWILISKKSFGSYLYTSSLVLAARIISIISLLYLAHTSKPEESRAWRFLVISQIFWWAADFILRITWLVTGESLAIPSISDFLQFAGSLAAIAMAISFPLQPSERFGRVREMLDTIVIALGVLALLWMILVLPALQIQIAPAITIYWSALAPIAGFVFLGLLIRLILLSSSRKQAVQFLLLGSAIFLQTLYDLFTGYQRMQGEWGPSGLLNILIIGSAILLLVLSDPRLTDQEGMGEAWAAETRLQRWEPFLPIGLTYLVIGLFLFNWWDSGEVLWLIVAAIALIAILLIARQGVIIGQVEMRRYAALVNTTADMAFMCDRQGNFKLANPAFYEMLDYSTRETLPQLGSIVNQEDFSLQPENETGEFSGEVNFIRSNGSTFPGILSLQAVLGGSATDLMYVGIGHDLTVIKNRESELEQALIDVAAAREDLQLLNRELETKVGQRTEELQKTIADLERLNEELKELDQLKSDFVALVSHELRAPLTNIRTGIELILRAYPGMESGISDSLALVQIETERLGSFVEAILNLSALEAGRFPLDLAPLPLDEIIEMVMKRFPNHSGVSRVCVDIPDWLPELVADERGLSSVIYHLIDNAVKYAPEGEIRIEASAAGNSVAVRIIDQGPGIPADERERIFDQFHRLDTRDSKRTYGHGLGLHLSKRMLEAMGGGIKIEDSPGKGAHFMFWLPCAGS